MTWICKENEHCNKNLHFLKTFSSQIIDMIGKCIKLSKNKGCF